MLLQTVANEELKNLRSDSVSYTFLFSLSRIVVISGPYCSSDSFLFLSKPSNLIRTASQDSPNKLHFCFPPFILGSFDSKSTATFE